MSDVTLRSGGATWVGALSAGQESNWDICLERGLWGSGANTAGGVKAGDEFLLWKSGVGKGWFARCVVTTNARRPSVTDPAPWDDGRDYKWIFGIRLLKQLEAPFNPGSTDNRQNITEIPNIRLGQFPKLSPDQASAARSFFGLANPPVTDEDLVNDEMDEAHERLLTLRTITGPVEVEQLVKARRGQGVYRSNLEAIEKCCRITGLRSVRHLRASHIKPWRVSNDEEKIDGHNGLLLSPHCDHLFDRGWVMFSDDGRMVASTRLEPEVLKAWRIEPPTSPAPFLPQQIEYLEYHRELIFRT
jgi:HNH endonuclease